jgi:hypothetical protein
MLTAQNDRKGAGLPSTGKAFSSDLSIAAIRKKSVVSQECAQPQGRD